MTASVSRIVLAVAIPVVSGFVTKKAALATTVRRMSAQTNDLIGTPSLYDPLDETSPYRTNLAKYLVDLHDAEATFDFCGGMMFQLVLTEALREELAVEAVASSKDGVVLHDASVPRMFQVPGYSKSAEADNARIFHGREIRKVRDAVGGMGMVLQLSSSVETDGKVTDPEGWTAEEVAGYDGWGHDAGRTWRDGERLEREGFSNFRSRFGPNAFALHHRFYLHLDNANRMWLSAEDGCEGTPAQSWLPRSASSPQPGLSNLFGLLK